jgi:hypothetical protein
MIIRDKLKFVEPVDLGLMNNGRTTRWNLPAAASFHKARLISGQLITGAVNSSAILFMIGMLDLNAAKLWIFHGR